MTSRSRPASFIARTAMGTIPFGSYPEVPTASFSSGIPKSSTAGIPRPAISRHCSTRRSTESWWFPGIDLISRCTLSPGQAKNGITRSSVRKLVSRTMLRMSGLLRRRRGRCGPIPGSDCREAGTPGGPSFIALTSSAGNRYGPKEGGPDDRGGRFQENGSHHPDPGYGTSCRARFAPQTAASADAKSLMRSSGSSMPTEYRISSSVMPMACRSSQLRS